METNTKNALEWIVGVLRKNEIPFQITAGLAAKVYGSNRPLFDIDIDVPETNIPDIVREVKEYITKGPYHLQDDFFDLTLLTLEYQGQPIDLGGAYEVKIRNKETGEWIEYPTDFRKSENHTIYGVDVPVVTKEELIHYKSLVARPTDLEDVKQLK
jgi:hypothetical protein